MAAARQEKGFENYFFLLRPPSLVAKDLDIYRISQPGVCIDAVALPKNQLPTVPLHEYSGDIIIWHHMLGAEERWHQVALNNRQRVVYVFKGHFPGSLHGGLLHEIRLYTQEFGTWEGRNLLPNGNLGEQHYPYGNFPLYPLLDIVMIRERREREI